MFVKDIDERSASEGKKKKKKKERKKERKGKRHKNKNETTPSQLTDNPTTMHVKFKRSICRQRLAKRDKLSRPCLR
jgi:hypothetical protein